MKNRLLEIYDLLLARYGHRHWWPAETPFEVCVGAILTQNTNWGNVEKAIANLKRDGLLSPAALHAVPVGVLAEAAGTPEASRAGAGLRRRSAYYTYGQ